MKTLLATLLGCVALAAVQEPSRPLAIEQLKGAGGRIIVHSSSFNANGPIPLRNSDYGEKVSPDVTWTGVPPTAKSLTLLVEDPDAREPKPFVHWILYNLPPSTSSLPESIPGTPRLPEFGGALQGRNSRGTTGYFGPRPPKTDPPHHYHFEIFAVDTMLPLDPGASATSVLAALEDHVVGSGELVAQFRAPSSSK